MANYKTNMQMSIIDNLFIVKDQELKQIAGNLQINDVKEDSRFAATVKRIKQQILLQPIVFGEPKIVTHQQTTRQEQPNFNNLFGGPQEIFIVTVSFPFTGSYELLDYSPKGMVPMGRIYQAYGNCIDIEVTLTKLDKAEAIAQAKQDMNTTFAFATANSQQAEQWSQTKAQLIDATLADRRKELIDFYS